MIYNSLLVYNMLLTQITYLTHRKIIMRRPRRTWTNSEVDFLKNNWGLLSITEIAIKLNRGLRGVAAKAFSLRVTKPDKPWTKQELIFLLNNYKDKGLKFCVDTLNRTEDSIRKQYGRIKANNFIIEDLDWKKIHKKKVRYLGYKDLSGSYWYNVKQNAKKRNLVFDLDIKDAYSILERQKFICALSGLTIKTVKSFSKNKKDQTASIDRIDSTKGYTIDNVQWVHKIINKLKFDMDQKRFIELCGLIYNRSRNDNNLST